VDATEMLGAPAHPGGLLVERPELTVGVVRAACSPTALELELIARPRRSGVRATAIRKLLPAYDEGIDLRLAGQLFGTVRAAGAGRDFLTREARCGRSRPPDRGWQRRSRERPACGWGSRQGVRPKKRNRPVTVWESPRNRSQRARGSAEWAATDRRHGPEPAATKCGNLRTLTNSVRPGNQEMQVAPLRVKPLGAPLLPVWVAW